MEVGFEITIIAAVFKTGGHGINILYMTQAVTKQLNETTQVIIKVYVKIDLARVAIKFQSLLLSRFVLKK